MYELGGEMGSKASFVSRSLVYFTWYVFKRVWHQQSKAMQSKAKQRNAAQKEN
jgi:hypothetical protein